MGFSTLHDKNFADEAKGVDCQSGRRLTAGVCRLAEGRSGMASISQIPYGCFLKSQPFIRWDRAIPVMWGHVGWVVTPLVLSVTCGEWSSLSCPRRGWPSP
ncbi:hypothetical protein ACOSQ2_029761 [Xanthoceras sorbifolium]